MDPISAITAAIVAGAVAAASETAEKGVKDAYAGLKTILIDTYKFVSTKLLDANPTDPDTKAAVRDEIARNPEIVNDHAVLEQAMAIQGQLQKETPEQIAAWGIDIKEVEAAGDVIVARVSGTGGGMLVGKIKSGGNISLTDITGGASSGKS